MIQAFTGECSNAGAMTCSKQMLNKWISTAVKYVGSNPDNYVSFEILSDYSASITNMQQGSCMASPRGHLPAEQPMLHYIKVDTSAKYIARINMQMKSSLRIII